MRSCRSPAYNRTGCGVRVGSPFRVQRCGSGLVRFRRVQVGIRHYGTGSGAMGLAVFGRWERGNRGRRGSGADATGCGGELVQNASGLPVGTGVRRRIGPKCVWVWGESADSAGIGVTETHFGPECLNAVPVRRDSDAFWTVSPCPVPLEIPCGSRAGGRSANPARTRGAAPRAACASEHGEPLTGGAAKQWWPLRAAGRPSGGAARRSASSPLWWSGRGRRGRQ